MQKRKHAEFIALVALLTAMVAMSIDTMLPAIGTMATELGASNPNDRQLIIVGFFAGTMLGTALFGPLSDTWGRKPAIYAGLALYVVGAVMCALAGSFPMLILGRVVQGFGASSPRVVAMAMVRDGHSGAAMARVMSFMMSVFMLVPILAPGVGQLVLYVTSWRMIFAGFIVAAIIAGLWLALRQEETLLPDKRRPFSLSNLASSAGEVVRHPVSFGYTLAVGGIFGAFITYLGTCQQIFAEQYQQHDTFALWFGALAVALAIAMFVNGRLVMVHGMRSLSKWALRGFIATWVLVVLANFVFHGHPPLVIMATLLFASFFTSGLIFGNYNAMAMEPMGHIAGMASAVSGALSSLIAVVLGGLAGSYYNGSMTPLGYTFLAYGLLALAASEWAERGRRRLVKKTAL